MAMDSPVLLCNTGVFMFPDMMAPAPGYYVGVVLSAELPAANRELFQDLLSQMTDLRVQVSVAAQSDLRQHNTCFDKCKWGLYSSIYISTGRLQLCAIYVFFFVFLTDQMFREIVLKMYFHSFHIKICLSI